MALASVLEGRVRLARSVLVVLKADGPILPLGADQPAFELQIDDLHLLLELSAAASTIEQAVEIVVERRGVAPAVLQPLVDVLETGTRLVAVGDERRSESPVGEASDVETAATAAAERGPFAFVGPVVLRPDPGGFELLDLTGEVTTRFAPAELLALRQYVTAQYLGAARKQQQRKLGADALDDAQFDALVSRGQRARILQPEAEASEAEGRNEAEFREGLRRSQVIEAALTAEVERHEAAVAGDPLQTGRVRVVPVQPQSMIAPLALGMIVAHARAYEDGVLDESYHFVPDWHASRSRLERYADDDGVYLFSNYVWSHEENIESSALVKARNPRSITVHGGPDTPRYPSDVEDYFRAHSHVDVAVHGEGEVTASELLAALRGAFDVPGAPDLSALADVPGLSFRTADGVVRTVDRDRIVDLDQVPSPYIDGMFDGYAAGHTATAIIETNRGCPYGCTFCDWGSATLSRIRKFDLERVFAELEWVARNEIGAVFVVDANFGILARDVEIAEKLASLKAEYGYPLSFSTNYAKNTVKHLRRIVEVMVGADIITEGLLSLQTMDETTLATVNRSNIKVEKYDALAGEFRKSNLPLFVDLMLGLPGSTVEGFRNDLQQCIDREVTAKIFQTEVLVNSPMNAPDYRATHEIETLNVGGGWYRTTGGDGVNQGRSLIVSTSSFSREEYDEMLTLRRVFRLFENFGVLRHVSRFVHQSTGIREADLFERLRRSVEADPDRWPTLTFTVETVPDVMVPPGSWQLFIDDLRSYLVDEIGVRGGSALETVLAVQLALLPARDREFPQTLVLEHDYVAWHGEMLWAKDHGQRAEWATTVPALETYGPGSLVVDDPGRVCVRNLGFRAEDHFYGHWELASSVSRAMPGSYGLGR